MNRLDRISLALLSIAVPLSAQAITVDGNLADWGINQTTLVPTVGIHHTIEDQTGNGAFYLNPGWGGQAYDAEAIYATIIGSRLFIALITGHNPTTLHNPAGNSFGASDFAIDFGKNGSYELGINIVHNGAGANADAITVSGGVYQVSSWNYGLWTTSGGYNPANPDPGNPTSIRSGTMTGTASLAYTTTGVSGYGSKASDLHYFYELGVDLDLLTGAGWDGQPFNIHWTENCANDSIIVDPPANVPEPGSLGLLGLGLVGLAGLRRRGH